MIDTRIYKVLVEVEVEAESAKAAKRQVRKFLTRVDWDGLPILQSYSVTGDAVEIDQ